MSVQLHYERMCQLLKMCRSHFTHS